MPGFSPLMNLGAWSDYYNATGGLYGYHGGIDLGSQIGTEVKAMVHGTVVIAERNPNGSTTGSGILTIS